MECASSRSAVGGMVVDCATATPAKHKRPHARVCCFIRYLWVDAVREDKPRRIGVEMGATSSPAAIVLLTVYRRQATFSRRPEGVPTVRRSRRAAARDTRAAGPQDLGARTDARLGHLAA